MAGSYLIYYLSSLLSYTGFVIAGTCGSCLIGRGWQNSPCSDCCCSRDIPKEENCCYKASEDTIPYERSVQGPIMYYVAIPFSIVLFLVFLFCCLRSYNNKCSRLLGRKPIDSNTNSNDNPPPYEYIEAHQIKVVIPESPPYVKDPPLYSEVVLDPSGHI